MPTMETIVRGFETNGVAPPRRYFSRAQFLAEPLVILQPGKVGATKTFSGSSSATTALYMDKKEAEGRDFAGKL